MLFNETTVSDFVIDGSGDSKFLIIKGPEIQIPKFRCPFGVSCFESDYGAPKYNLELEIHQSDRSKAFLNWLGTIESHVVNYVCENAMDIFGREMDREQIQGMFRSNLKEDRFRAKIDKDTMAKDPDGNTIDILSKGAMKGNTCVCVLKLKMVYFMNNNFGLVWNATQASFSLAKQPAKEPDFAEYQFLD
jgi:hypothetical protein